MSNELSTPSSPGISALRPAAPRTWRARFAYIGPGIVLAAAGIGAADMVTALSGAWPPGRRR
jgi:hypothetical protein